MILILPLDDENGRLFNKRRQSRDKVLNEYLLNLAGEDGLYMTSFSEKIFPEGSNIHILSKDELFGGTDRTGKYFFSEDGPVRELIEAGVVEMILVCRWNHRYPHDVVLDIPLPGNPEILAEFEGFSHEKITVEQYLLS